jgi:hypothetical protein
MLVFMVDLDVIGFIKILCFENDVVATPGAPDIKPSPT